MVDILHRIGVEQSSPERVYEALTTLDGLAGWWTEKASGSTDLDGVIEFRFRPGGFDMKVIELDPGRLVRWEVVGGPEEWIGTTVRWELRQEGDYTIVLFKHEGWREPVEFMNHCSTKWATFLLSLKELVETGEGAPDPRDVKISDWH
ncbi:SRPBCC family protein [Streptomyces sp. NBC_01198]|uniref:SRPBCC family protein n=1 Tax=Streptomyces sp. NBC_01198 TaxID=2903769 RepID=UPI002E0D62EB|nr:SRPBCC domain-containing protein [Streptomyces sp. NBC_01198]